MVIPLDVPADVTLICKPILLGATTLEQLLNAANGGTKEVVDYLKKDCDIVIECKKCRALHRSLANFILHKRIYCNNKTSMDCPANQAVQNAKPLLEKTTITGNPHTVIQHLPQPGSDEDIPLNVKPVERVYAPRPRRRKRANKEVLKISEAYRKSTRTLPKRQNRKSGKVTKGDLAKKVDLNCDSEDDESLSAFHWNQPITNPLTPNVSADTAVKAPSIKPTPGTNNDRILEKPVVPHMSAKSEPLKNKVGMHSSSVSCINDSKSGTGNISVTDSPCLSMLPPHKSRSSSKDKAPVRTELRSKRVALRRQKESKLSNPEQTTPSKENDSKDLLSMLGLTKLSEFSPNKTESVSKAPALLGDGPCNGNDDSVLPLKSHELTGAILNSLPVATYTPAVLDVAVAPTEPAVMVQSDRKRVASDSFLDEATAGKVQKIELPETAEQVASNVLESTEPTPEAGPAGSGSDVADSVETMFVLEPKSEGSKLTISDIKGRNDCDWHKLKCLKCDTTYSCMKTLVNHMSCQHYNKRIFYPCIYCANIYSQHKNVARHIRKHHRKTKEFTDQLRDFLRSQAFVRIVSQSAGSLTPSKEEEFMKKLKASRGNVPLYSQLSDDEMLKRFGQEINFCPNRGRPRKDPQSRRKTLTYPCIYCDKRYCQFKNVVRHLKRSHEKSADDIVGLKSEILGAAKYVDETASVSDGYSSSNESQADAENAQLTTESNRKDILSLRVPSEDSSGKKPPQIIHFPKLPQSAKPGGEGASRLSLLHTAPKRESTMTLVSASSLVSQTGAPVTSPTIRLINIHRCNTCNRAFSQINGLQNHSTMCKKLASEALLKQAKHSIIPMNANVGSGRLSEGEAAKIENGTIAVGHVSSNGSGLQGIPPAPPTSVASLSSAYPTSVYQVSTGASTTCTQEIAAGSVPINKLDGVKVEKLIVPNSSDCKHIVEGQPGRTTSITIPLSGGKGKLLSLLNSTAIRPARPGQQMVFYRLKPGHSDLQKHTLSFSGNLESSSSGVSASTVSDATIGKGGDAEIGKGIEKQTTVLSHQIKQEEPNTDTCSNAGSIQADTYTVGLNERDSANPSPVSSTDEQLRRSERTPKPKKPFSN